MEFKAPFLLRMTAGLFAIFSALALVAAITANTSLGGAMFAVFRLALNGLMIGVVVVGTMLAARVAMTGKF